MAKAALATTVVKFPLVKRVPRGNIQRNRRIAKFDRQTKDSERDIEITSIRKLMESFTDKEIADATGCHPHTIGRLREDDGTKWPRFATLQRIANAFGENYSRYVDNRFENKMNRIR